uniref:NAD(P)(+)--arginine ADP-ribosyltransferase n=1 Tax=Arcella intermedia TaxID=1963864 RepID=A0A6B2KYG3_9EUKA
MGHAGDRVAAPNIIPTITKASQICCGGSFSMCVCTDGTLYSWGNNEKGQLGLGHHDNVYKPTLVALQDKILRIAACGNHALALNSDGLLFSWGANTSGELGTGDTMDLSTPQRILGLIGVQQIACGWKFSIALTSSGLYAWGCNQRGQLGLGHTENQSFPTAVKFPTEVKITQIGCGSSHVLVATDRELYSWGENEFGQLGIGKQPDHRSPVPIVGLKQKKVIQICCGYFHNFAITAKSVYCWGQNLYCQLGLGHSDDRNTPQKMEFFTKEYMPCIFTKLKGIELNDTKEMKLKFLEADIHFLVGTVGQYRRDIEVMKRDRKALEAQLKEIPELKAECERLVQHKKELEVQLKEREHGPMQVFHKQFGFSPEVISKLQEYGIRSVRDLFYLGEEDWKNLGVFIKGFELVQMKERLADLKILSNNISDESCFDTVLQSYKFDLENLIQDIDKIPDEIFKPLKNYLNVYNSSKRSLFQAFSYLLPNEIKELIYARVNNPEDIQHINDWKIFANKIHPTSISKLITYGTGPKRITKYLQTNIDDIINFNELISLPPSQKPLPFVEAVYSVFDLRKQKPSEYSMTCLLENGKVIIKKFQTATETSLPIIMENDEYLAIYFYTEQWRDGVDNLYEIINSNLAAKTRNEDTISKCRSFLFYLLNGIKKLPDTTYSKLYRGIKKNLLTEYPDKYVEGKTITWYSFTSTSASPNIATEFLSDCPEGTQFVISDVTCGKSICEFSSYKNEKEVLLPPGTTFCITKIEKQEKQVTIHLKYLSLIKKQEN